MQTIILAGGAGNRIHPLSVNKSKPMFKVIGKPLLHHVLDILKESGLKDFIIVTGIHGDQIKNYFGNGKSFGVSIRYTHQEKSLGMANAIQTAKGLIDGRFLVVNGDDIFEPSLIKSMLKENSDFILPCKQVEETWKFGILDLSGNKIKRIVEKPKSGKEPSKFAIVGAYILPSSIFDYYQKVPVSDMQHEIAMQKYIDDGNKAIAVKYNGFFSAFKYPWDLFTVNQHLMNKLLTKKKIEPGAYISKQAVVEGNVHISKGARILGNAYVKGPVYIGENAIIGNSSFVRNYSSIGDKSVVGFSTEISNSVIGENCWFHSNYVGDSIIDDNCSFGSGAVLANFRFDEDTIKVNVNGDEIDSGREKLGAVIANNSMVGVNATLLPGVKLGPDSVVGPNVSLREDLPANKVIFIDKESYVTKENKIKIKSKKNKLYSNLRDEK